MAENVDLGAKTTKLLKFECLAQFKLSKNFKAPPEKVPSKIALQV